MTNISPWAAAALATTAAVVASTTAAGLVILSSSPVAHAFASPTSSCHRILTHPGITRVGSTPLSGPSYTKSSSSATATAATTTALAAQRDKYNPFKTLLGDMASSLFSSSSGSTISAANPNVDSAISSLVTSTWDDVRTKLETKQTPIEKSFRTNLPYGYGPPSPLHTVRLYDSTNTKDDVRVTFYRDSASWCPYCQKVWIMLEEKRIPYRVEKINMRCYGDKPVEFQRMQPSGQIPVAKIDGVVYNQSNDIMMALETKFPNHKQLNPKDEKNRMKAQELLRLERRLFSAWMYWLTGSREPDRYKSEFVSVLSETEEALQSSRGGDFFLGKQVSLVDLMFVPFLERMCASLLYYKGYQIRVAKGDKTDFPAINRWFDAMETLESYQLTKSDYYTHCWDLPPQLGGCTYEAAGEIYEKAINGERTIDGTRGSWELPLQKHNGGIEPDWNWAGDEKMACREAVERVSGNHENIVKFAARGAGRKGMPPYTAPLADPNAVPNEAVVASIDAVLRTLSLAMLEGTNGSHDEQMGRIAEIFVKEGGKDYAESVIACLAYMRDRVGVPRDMKLPAARQLRAHLNWSIGKILNAIDTA